MKQLSIFENKKTSPDVDKAQLPQEKIVFSKQWINDFYGITEEIQEHTEKAIELAKKARKTEIRQLKKYIENYPEIPHFKNYLAFAYSNKGDYKMAKNLCWQIIEEHPNYIFGRLTFAKNMVLNGKPEKALDLLNNKSNLQELFPEREKFDIDEVMLFWSVCCNVMIKQNNFDEADEYLALMKETDAGHPDIIETEKFRFQQLMLNASERLE